VSSQSVGGLFQVKHQWRAGEEDWEFEESDISNGFASITFLKFVGTVERGGVYFWNTRLGVDHEDQ
jgi:hypothetical protein